MFLRHPVVQIPTKGVFGNPPQVKTQDVVNKSQRRGILSLNTPLSPTDVLEFNFVNKGFGRLEVDGPGNKQEAPGVPRDLKVNAEQGQTVRKSDFIDI